EPDTETTSLMRLWHSQRTSSGRLRGFPSLRLLLYTTISAATLSLIPVAPMRRTNNGQRVYRVLCLSPGSEQMEKPLVLENFTGGSI
ncbi:hypothetical protein L917_16974, partial [Phytophthora nicotianae]